MAVYPAPFPRPIYAPPSSRVPRAAVPRRAAPVLRTRPRELRRRRDAGRPTFALTPLAPVFGFAVLASAAVIGLVRAVAVVPAIDGPGVSRRRHASRARLARTGQRIGLGIALIVVVFCAGLIYVDRAVQISARSYDLATLQAEHDDLLRQEQTLQNDLARLGSEVAVGHEALAQGLIRLGPPILVPAS